MDKSAEKNLLRLIEGGGKSRAHEVLRLVIHSSGEEMMAAIETLEPCGRRCVVDAGDRRPDER